MTTGKIYPILYCGDIYKFYVDKDFDLVGVEKHYLGCLTNDIEFSDVPPSVQKDFLEQAVDDRNHYGTS